MLLRYVVPNSPFKTALSPWKLLPNTDLRCLASNARRQELLGAFERPVVAAAQRNIRAFVSRMLRSELRAYNVRCES